MGDKQEQADPGFFAVEPRFDCPHVTEEMMDRFLQFLDKSLDKYDRLSARHVYSDVECEDCKDAKENWVCLGCSGVHCSRYVCGDMARHNQKTDHPVTFSLGDGSFWCYRCDSYITSVELGKLRKVFGFIKHKMEAGMAGAEPTDRVYSILQRLVKLNEGQATFKRSELVEGLKTKKFKKVCIVTGAGISVSAGIPDFRSPGGLYHKLAAKYNLTKPEEIMTLEFFKTHPEPLYEIMKEFMTASVGGISPRSSPRPATSSSQR